ncbi:MAG: class I SAM-dependent methyltransferase, partial [Phycisphaerae bacterium]
SRPTVLDYGCGYGAYAEHLKRHDIEVNFTGYDLVKDSIQMAKEKNPNGNWISALPEGEMWDYVLASGIFNTLAETSREDWESYIFQTLSELHSLSNKAFGCNFLTDYSDKDKMRPDLYYADPAKILSYCLKKFGRTVTLIHDYPLYEFTILVRSTK